MFGQRPEPNLNAAQLHDLVISSPARALAELQRSGQVPQAWQGELLTAIVDDFEHGTSRVEYYLSAQGQRRRLYSTNTLPAASCPAPISVRGYLVGDEILAQSFQTLQPPLDAPACLTTGVQNTVVLLASFPSMALPSNITPSFAQTAFTGLNRSVDGYYRDASYGRASVTATVVGPFTLDADYSCTDSAGLVDAAMRATDSAVDFQLYNRIVVIAPRNAANCPLGVGTVGCWAMNTAGDGNFQASWMVLGSDYLIANDAVVSVAAHEMGHNLGLGHAYSRDYGAQPLGALDATPVDREYWDIFSMMGLSYSSGSQYVIGHFGAEHKALLGWLSLGSDYQLVQSTGTYTVNPYSDQTANLKALRVRRGTGVNEWLWLEYRQPVGAYDSTLSAYSPLAYSGALIRHQRATDTLKDTFLLDFRPQATPNDFSDAPLLPGVQWDDPYSNLSLTTAAVSGALQVTATYRASSCVYAVLPASINVPAAGGAFYFDVTTGASCAYQATTSDTFLTLGAGASGTGSGRVNFSAAANPAAAPRSGSIVVNGQGVSVLQAAAPALSITKTHIGNFAQGQANAEYSVIVSNSGSAGPTSGVVTVTETPPAGLTLVSMSGAGWICVSNACTRSDVLAAACSYPALVAAVNVSPSATSPQVNSVSVSGGGSSSASATDATTILAHPPVLTITKVHSGSFTQGQTGAVYSVIVRNSGSAGPTSGLVTVTETPPAGLTLVSMSGAGWTCASNTCTRSDVLGGGISYAAITVTVNVSSSATSPQVNAVSVSGGGSAMASTTDSTTITANPPSLTITKTHGGNFTQGQTGAVYSVIVSNAALAGPTSGVVTVTETPPSGLTLVSMSGAGWTCSSNTCTRSDVLGATGSYPAITATVNVSSAATSPQVNAVSVSGGGSAAASTTDSTAITAHPPVLTITKSHAGSFTQGQTGAVYSVIVSNAALAGPTSGLVTVTETTPSGLTLVSMSGAGWTCSSNTCTRSDVLSAASSYPAITATVNVSSSATSPQVNAVSVSGGGSSAASTTDSTAITAHPPVLTITKSHAGSFTQGQTGAVYSVIVSNAALAGPTSGLVTVTETPPSGLTLVSMSGSGWTCSSNTCTRSDVLSAAGSYPAITATVNVSSSATSPQVNSVSVSGGDSATASTTDSTTIIANPPSLTITKTHAANFTQGQTGAVYSVLVSNSGSAGPTSGVVTVTETPPSGLTLVSMSGSGWTCSSNTCTRSDVLSAAGSYPAITATVNVSSSATSPQVNSVSVSGGGSATASTTDSTPIIAHPPVLTITKTHAGNVTQGQAGAVYSVIVSNAGSAGPTSGLVTVTETPPSGLTLVSMSGAGWTCSSNTCTRSDVLSAAGSYPAITATVNVSSSATSPQVNAVSVSGGGSSAASATDPTTINPGTTPVTLVMTPSALTFGGSSSGASLTPGQEIFLGMTGASNSWTATSSSPWLSVTPAAGQGSSRLTVSIRSSALPALGTHTGTITVSANGATNGPLAVNCTLVVKSATTSPFGFFDTPADNPTGLGGSHAIAGSIAVTGWALDDIGVKQVTVWRDPVGPEAVHPNGYVYIGDSLFVAGTRPDVEAAFPSLPRAHRAGWGYMLLTNTLPSGNGLFRMHAIAVDEEGNQVELGAKTIVVDNLHATKPFGAIDAPAPGEAISGSILNQGWALTPQPASIATNGSTIWVVIDGVELGHPLFGGQRGDIASIFPGFANSNSAAGQYVLDSTRFTNSTHTIAWNVYDNLGRGDGIGSRYFDIRNGGTAAIAAPEPMVREAADAERALQLRAARLQRPTAPVAGFPAFRQGYDQSAPLMPIRQAGAGLLAPIDLNELGRLEVHLPGGQLWSAALRVGDERRELPIGSTFDAEGGIFYWQLGPAFLGEYLLEFRGADGTVLPVPVRVGVVTP